MKRARMGSAMSGTAAWKLAILWATIAACSSPSGVGGGAMPGCLANATQQCWCGAAVQGVQTCVATGGGWSPCSCLGAQGDATASATDAAGADAAATDADAGAGKTDDGAADSNAAEATAEDGSTVADTDVAEAGSAPGDSVDGSDVDWSELLDPEDAATGNASTPDSGVDAGSDSCPERAKIVYVVTATKQLLSFTPDKLKFELVGTLACPGTGSGQPFSMAVDRLANAWVLYSTVLGSGAGVFKVSTLDASCQPTSYQNAALGFDLFGMGFSADQPALPAEHLWIAGTKGSQFSTGSCKLGTLNTATMQPAVVGPLPASYGCPDLTGNGNAELYGFFPNASPPAIGMVNKATGQIAKSWPLPAQAFSNTEAWAFAQWGGLLWLFFKSYSAPSSSVWTLDPASGKSAMVVGSTGYKIVGAGVSSCAPTKAVAP